MTYEALLVGGCLLAALSIVSLVSAWADRRSPRLAAIFVVVSGGVLLTAVGKADDGFQLVDIPLAFVEVITSFLK